MQYISSLDDLIEYLRSENAEGKFQFTIKTMNQSSSESKDGHWYIHPQDAGGKTVDIKEQIPVTNQLY